jgi:hypothetical protein
MRVVIRISAQRVARDRSLTRIFDSPPRRAALCAESVERLAATGADTGFLTPLRRRGPRFLAALASSAILHGVLAAGAVAFVGVSKNLFPYEDYRPRFHASVMVPLSPVRPALQTKDTKPLDAPKEAIDPHPSARSMPDPDPDPAPAVPPEPPPPPARASGLPSLPRPLPIHIPMPVITETPSLPGFPLGGFQASLEMALPFPNLLPPGLPRQDDPQVEAIWKNHSPSGSYDVVIVQSAASVGKRFGAAILTGTVYVVYLDVGLPRMSALEFSVPPSAGPVVNLDADDIAAPYPSVTVVPKSAQSLGDVILVHGFVTTEGRLRDLSISSNDHGAGNSQLGKALLAMMENWVFRPAKRGDRPVEVEIVLAI